MPTRLPARRHGRRWNRDELVLTLELYCRTPFAKTKASNESVMRLADFLGRAPGAVAMKLGNLGAQDPSLRVKRISGLQHGSADDKAVWDEFHGRWEALVDEANRLRLLLATDPNEEPFPLPEGPSERMAACRERVHQRFFRDAVLSSYAETCCVTGISVPECLAACHIVPWHVDAGARSDPTNGLCLSGTFHMLFDAGLMAISGDHHVRLSRRILRLTDKPNRELLLVFDGKGVRLPDRFAPHMERLAWHRTHVFNP